MMTFTDRQPAVGKENRYKLTKADGSFEYVKLERADEANPVGTPLNKTTFENMQEEVAPVIGTYTGNGTILNINLGFKPRAVFVDNGDVSTDYRMSRAFVIKDVTINNYLKIEDNGFSVKTNSGSTSDNYLNSNGHQYMYVAFR